MALVAVGWASIMPGDRLAQRVADIAERHADRNANLEEVCWALRQVADWQNEPAESTGDIHRAYLGRLFGAALTRADWYDGGGVVHLPGQHSACDAIRDVFGRWSHTVLVRAAWLSANDGAAAKVARAIYDEKRFTDLPILCDALLEAGCDEDALVLHLCGTGPHFRGCWALDAVLSRLAD